MDTAAEQGASVAAARLDGEYVLPLRWEDDADRAELTAYLEKLARWIDVSVIDGSPAALAAGHEAVWPWVRHLVPDVPGRNGKARGAMTGIRSARHDKVVIADDDVRYEPEQLAVVLGLLDEAELVRPQNVFDPLPWHARWDTGRTLMNRGLGADYCGTTAIRRSALPPGGYDTDVLFENLELERTISARGGRVRVAPDVYVARRPPTARRFLEQRVRQAYDDFAQPLRLIREMAILPAILTLALRRNGRGLLAVAAGGVAIAAWGRVRAGGRAHFRATDPLWAVPWMLERAVTVWLAVILRIRGGVRYRDGRLHRAATPIRRLKRRLA